MQTKRRPRLRSGASRTTPHAASAPKGRHNIKVYFKHLPCLFPQHGPGKKHERPIALDHWQQDIVDAHPWEFIRGLIHSDGCRITNWTEKVIGGERKRYEYPGTSSPTRPPTSWASSPTPSTGSASNGRTANQSSARPEHLRRRSGTP